MLIAEIVIDNESTVGWTIVPFYRVGQAMFDYSTKHRPYTRCLAVTIQLTLINSHFRISFYSGTPRILPFLNAQSLLGGNSTGTVLHKNGDVIELALMTHTNMMNATDFVPENILVGSRDIVPGLQPNANGGSEQLDNSKH